MNILLRDINCPYCNSTSLSFYREEDRYGFCYTIVLSCSACDTQVSSTYSSRRTAVKKSSPPFVVNDLVVFLFNQLGPKTVFIGKHKLHGATASAIASFHEGSSHLSHVMQKMAIETNELLNVYMEELDQRRRISANVSSSATTQRERAGRWI